MIRWEALRGRNRFYLALDLLMLALALFNVLWLGFDASYLYLRDHNELPCRVRFTMPEGWKVSTGLTAAKAIAWAKPDLIGDEEVATIMAVCTPREAEVLEDVVANCW